MKTLSKILFILFLFSILIIPASASGLLASPAKLKYDIKPLQNVTGQITIQNIGNNTVNVTIQNKRLQLDNEHLIYSDEGIAKCIHLPLTNFTLEPGAIKNVPFSLLAPENIDYSDSEGALIVQGTAANTSENTVLDKVELIVPIILGVPGPIIDSLEMIKHNIPIIAFPYTPVNFKYELRNNGTVYSNITGEIDVKGLLSNYTVPISGLIYPGDVQTLSSTWTPGLFDSGLYKVDTNIQYGRFQQNQTLQTHDTLFVIPIWLPLVLISLFPLIFLVMPHIGRL